MPWQSQNMVNLGNMFNCLQALKYARKIDFKLIIGCEAYITDNMSIKEKPTGINNRIYHIVLLAKNQIGYKNLCTLISIAYRDGFYGYPRLDHQTLEKYSDGLICLTACVNGEIPKYVLDLAEMEANPEIYTGHDMADADQLLNEIIIWYQDVFKDDLYFELMPGNFIDNRIKNKRLIELSDEYGIKLVVTNDVHYDTKENAYWHDILLACSTGTTMMNPNRLRYGQYLTDETPRFNTGEQFFWANAELKNNKVVYHNSLEEPYDKEIGDGNTYTFKLDDIYYMISEEEAKDMGFPSSAIESVADILNKCEIYNEITFDPASKMPSYRKFREPKSAIDLIDEICKDNWQWKLDHLPPMAHSKYGERYEFELGVIANMGFEDYFLILWDIVSWAKKQGIYVGPGRGSAGGSLVVYLLDVTDVDPIQWGLYFERFLNPDRISMPDIDIDFEQGRRSEVVNYIIDRFGAGNVSQIITFTRLKAKSVILQAGAVLGVPYSERQRITNTIDALVEKDTKIADIYAAEPGLYNMIKGYPGLGEMWVQLIDKLEMAPKSAGQHAAGTIISPHTISDNVPVYYSKGEPSAMFDMNLLEDLGYVKFDILGVKTLDHIRLTVEFVEKNRGEKLNPWRLPLDDHKTLKLYTSGKLTGVFQCKYPGFRRLAQRLDPDTFMHVVDLMCLYRPGPLKEGMTQDYINRRHGEAVESKFHKDVQKILEPTYGIMLYQEQTMEVARTIFGWSFSEADELRKAIGKKKLDLMNKLKDKALDQADEGKTPYPKDIVERTFELIEPAARYSWNKAHGVEYGLISYVTAYLKAHYPVEFYAALLYTEIGSSDELSSILTDVRSEGIGLVEPNVNKSTENFHPDGDSIIFGFSSMKSVGDKATRAIIKERVNGPFTSFVNFCNRVPPSVCNKTVKKALIHSGAFDFDQYNRRTLIEAIDPLTKKTKTKTKTVQGQKIKYSDKVDEDLEKLTIINMVPSSTDPTKKVKKERNFEVLPEYEEGELLKHERDILGIQVSGHVLDKYDFINDFISHRVRMPISGLLKQETGWLAWTIGVVASLKKHIDKNGNQMAFITIADQNASIDCVCFANEFASIGKRIAIGGPVIIKVRVNIRQQQVNGIIDELFRLDAAIPLTMMTFEDEISTMDEISIEALFGEKPIISNGKLVYFKNPKPLTSDTMKKIAAMNNRVEIFK